MLTKALIYAPLNGVGFLMLGPWAGHLADKAWSIIAHVYDAKLGEQQCVGVGRIVHYPYRNI
jgi:hypothetical protein